MSETKQGETAILLSAYLDGELDARRQLEVELWLVRDSEARRLLEEAYARAGATHATDDASLVEAFGRAVRIVPDTPRNLKITTRDDLALAEALAASGT